MKNQNRDEKTSFEDMSKLVFKDQYAGADRIDVRVNGRLYPTNKDAILRRIKISGAKVRDLRFFTQESIEKAKKKS